MLRFSSFFGLGIVVVFATCIVAVSAASASPEFTPSTSNQFTGKSGIVAMENSAGPEIACAVSESHGEITGATTVGKVEVRYSGCTAEKGECSAKTKGRSTGEIVLSSVKGELGTTKEAVSGVALLLEPESGTLFVEVEGSCLTGEKAEITGSVAGEVCSISPEPTIGGVAFLGENGKAAIKEVNRDNGKAVKPKLTGPLGTEASLTDPEEFEFAKAVEVTGCKGKPTAEFEMKNPGGPFPSKPMVGEERTIEIVNFGKAEGTPGGIFVAEVQKGVAVGGWFTLSGKDLCDKMLYAEEGGSCTFDVKIAKVTTLSEATVAWSATVAPGPRGKNSLKLNV
jgi:hypothetical protein